MIKFVFKILFLVSLFIFSDVVKANYWLVIGTYRQGPGGRPEVSGITRPSMQTIPMRHIETTEKAEDKISKEIYKPLWQFDNKWTCIYDGISK